MTCFHHYSIIQSSFTILKILGEDIFIILVDAFHQYSLTGLPSFHPLCSFPNVPHIISSLGMQSVSLQLKVRTGIKTQTS